MTFPPWLLYLFPIVVIYVAYIIGYRRKQLNNRTVLQDSIEADLTQPPSLHPVINHDRCIGCEACVNACPEFPAHAVLGVIASKAHLISPTDCIGHGACKAACPVDAISLVFGTSERGVDIPPLTPDFQTNQKGIYIAGELGGMGLIRNAVEQGRQAMEAIVAAKPHTRAQYQVAIVGAGPAGLAATLAAQAAGLSYVTIERNSLGGTVANFPRGKLVMTAPVELPLYGKMYFKETSKEALIEFWQGVEQQTGIDVQYGQTVTQLTRQGDVFELVTDQGQYSAACVLLALGRRGTPRKLGVPGEELPKVIYTLIDPSEYGGQRVLVVGGGDSALEAANAIAEEPGSRVALSYRSNAFSRAKRKNREKLSALVEAGDIELLLNSQVEDIGTERVRLSVKSQDGEQLQRELDNDAVIICAGGILPTGFLQETGIEVETKHGVA